MRGRAFTPEVKGLKIKCTKLKIDVESVIQIHSISPVSVTYGSQE